jgi:type VI secretion system secreted protein Hcp
MKLKKLIGVAALLAAAVAVISTFAVASVGTAGGEPNQRLVGYLQVKGQRLGVIKGGSVGPKRQDWIDVLGFDYAVTSPRDAATGQATGKRQHKPFRITKTIDKSTPLLFQALVTNEVLSEVTFELVRTQPDGTEAVVYRVKLANAALSDIHQYDEGKAGQQSFEELSFVFQKIDLTWVDGGISATDSWAA